jgi:glycosyltransferase involved in cell wall biosynthesis
MKVLVFPSSYPTKKHPLAGSFVREQANLISSDHDVRLLYPNTVKKADLIGKASKGRLPEISDEYQLIEPPRGKSAFFVNLNGAPERVKFEYVLRRCESQLRSFIDDGWAPDLIHAHDTVWAGSYAVQLGAKYGIPVALTEHRNPFLLHGFSSRQRKRIVRTLESADVLATVSNHQSRSILSHDISCSPIPVGNLVDDELFTIAEPRRRGPFTILTVGGIAFYKDPRTFLRSIAEVRARGRTDFHARIIGIQNASHEFNDLFSEYQIGENCEFLPAVPREEMHRQYAECDVVVSTSIAETFGISIGEALASGRPVISTRNGGAEDFVHASNGFLVNVQDHDAIADRIVSLMENGFPSTPEQIRASIVSEYGRDAFRQKLNSLYQRAIDNFGSRN